MNNNAIAPVNYDLTTQEGLNAYLAEQDKQFKKNNSGGNSMRMNEIRVVSSDKDAEDLGCPKGSFIKVYRNANDEMVKEVIEGKLEVVILKTTNSYSHYDEAQKKTVMFTNEFERGTEDRILLRNSEGVELFRGNTGNFKQFANARYTNGREGNIFKYKFVLYVLMVSELASKPAEECLYKMYASVSSMDSIREYNQSLEGNPVRYVTNMMSDKKDVGSNRVYFLKPVIARTIDLTKIGNIVKVQMELNSTFKEYTDTIFNQEPATVDDIEDEPIVNTPTKKEFFDDPAGIDSPKAQDIPTNNSETISSGPVPQAPTPVKDKAVSEAEAIFDL